MLGEAISLWFVATPFTRVCKFQFILDGYQCLYIIQGESLVPYLITIIMIMVVFVGGLYCIR